MEYKYTGIILNKKDIGETDRLYNIYTLEKGKISAIARGVRKVKSKLAGHLENFYLIDLIIMKNKGMGNISGSVVENNFSILHQNLENLNKVFDAVKIFSRLINDEEKDNNLFLLLLSYLKTMNSEFNDNIKGALITQGFIFKLLELLGYKVEVNKCVKCCKSLGYGNCFDFSLGGVVCINCSRELKNIMPINNNSIKIIRIFFQNNLYSLNKLNIKKKDIRELERVSKSFLRWIL